MRDFPALTPEEEARYEWQMWTDGLGTAGQRQLKAASVLISRIGGVGGTVAYYLAAAGVGKLILAHAGNIKPSDLNRQLLMTTAALGTSRVACARQRIADLNPHVTVIGIEQNIGDYNADGLVAQADVVVGAAPLFEERLALNRAAVSSGRPFVDAAMFDMEARLTTVIPGRSACLACLHPEIPPAWRREFPVIGAVSGAVAALAAVEVIKLITGIGDPATGRLVQMNLRTMEFRSLSTRRRPACLVCQGAEGVSPKGRL